MFPLYCNFTLIFALKHHITSLCSKVNGTLSFENSARKGFGFKLRVMIVFAQVSSYINFCPFIRGKCSNTHREKLLRCINFAARITCEGNNRKRDHVSSLRKKFQWLNMNNGLPIQQSIQIHKEFKGKHSPDKKMHSYFRGEKNNRLTRNNDSVHVEYKKIKTDSRAFSITGINFWNTSQHTSRILNLTRASGIGLINTSWPTNLS